LQKAYNLSQDTVWQLQASFIGDFVLSAQNLLGVVGKYVNVALGLIGIYNSLAIYQYLYTIGSNLINWAANPSLPNRLKTNNY